MTDRAERTSGGENWGQEWRADISRQVNEGAHALQAAALAIERVNGRLEDHDRRIELLEGKPDKMRADLGTFGGCSSQLAYLGVSLLSLALAALALLSSHVSLH